jgi:hypothetical protein
VPATNIVIAGSGTNRTVQITPASNKFGSATITLTVMDSDSSTSSQSFLVTVAPVNDAPTLAPISDLTIAENSGLQTVALTGISSGSADEIQTLSVTAVSSVPSLIPNPTVTYTSPASTGTLTFTPVANRNGTTTISVFVNDGLVVVSRTFQVTVTPVNTLPAISSIADRTIAENTQTGLIPFTVSDDETPASSLIASTRSSNPMLVPPANIVVSGSGTNRAVNVIPAPNTFGKANITLTVSDSAGAMASSTFSLTVTATLRIAHAGPNVILTWAATNAVLQESGQMLGSWQDVAPLRTSPCTMPATGLKFLRLRESQ